MRMVSGMFSIMEINETDNFINSCFSLSFDHLKEDPLMSMRESIVKTFKEIRDEYREVETADKIFDIISLVGIVLFFVSALLMSLNNKINPINIAFSIYPLAIAGTSTAIRMKLKKITDEEEASKIFKEYVTIIGLLTVLVLIVIIFTVLIYV